MNNQSTVASEHSSRDPDRELSYRQTEVTDAAGTLSLFKSVFGVERAAPRVEWQYRASPAGPGAISIAADAAGNVVGCLGFMRMDFNHLGLRLPAGQACDGMVLPEFRGRDAFSSLYRQNVATAFASGWQLIIGFPNPASFPILVGRLGQHRIAVMKHYFRRIGARRLLRAGDTMLKAVLRASHATRSTAERWRISSGLAVATTREVPADIEEALAAHRRAEVLSVWKDVAYLDWRYARHPEHRYDVHVLRFDGKPRAIAVCRVGGHSIGICELMHRAHDVRESAFLLREITATYVASGAQIVEFYGWDRGFFDAAFAAAGFKASAFSPLQLIAHVRESSMIVGHASNPFSWTVCYGDTDIT